MSTKLDQKEYLKKYLSGKKKDEKKKKKKRIKAVGSGMRIIDVDDMDVSKMRVLESHELDLFGDKEDAPQIAGIIDDRPEELKKLENFSSDKWKVINRDDGYNATITIEQITNKKTSHKMIDGNSAPNSDSDLSPQRDTKKYDSDLSPERYQSQENKHSKPVLSEKIKNKKDEQNLGSDLSPPRHHSHRRDENRIIKRKNTTVRNNSDSDLSPPRNNKRKDSKREDRANISSKNSKKDDMLMYIPNSDSDLSPPRSNKSKGNNVLDVPPAKMKYTKYTDHRKANKIDSDVSPQSPSIKKENSFSKFSPERKIKTENLRIDKKNEGRRKKSRWNDSDNDNSVSSDLEKSRPNKGENRDSHLHRNKKIDTLEKNDRRRENHKHHESKKNNDRDRSPFQNKRQTSDTHEQSEYRNKSQRNDNEIRNKGSDSQKADSRSHHQRMDKTLDGKRAGLQDARQLKTENDEFKKKENELFGKLSEEFTGKNAQTIKRDMRTGKPTDTEEEKRQLLEKEEKQKVTDGKYSRWGKGLKQIEEQEAKVKEYLHEAAKPLARYKDDQDLDRALMGRERTGDPMLEYMRKIDQEKMKNEGFEALPIYKGPYPPNRFDLRPGHRWDGVDRSNGHEKNYFQAKSNKKAMDAESYKWSTEDM